MGSLISLLVMSSSIQFTALTFLSICFVIFTPYTKVEESFNIQAIHDFMYIGFPRAYQAVYQGIKDVHSDLINYHPVIHTVTTEYLNLDDCISSFFPEPESFNLTFDRWDHQDFPGVVYRSFIGSFFISILTLPFTFVTFISKDKFHLQLISRVILSIFVISGFNSFANAIGKKYGSTTRRSLIVLTLTQFHFIYYDSRTLPNTYALGLTLFAYSHWIRGRFNRMIVLVAITVVIFRFETGLLFGIIFLYEIFINKSLTIKNLLVIGIPSGILSLSTTVLFDTYIWGSKTWIWPEGHSMYFNIYLNKSNEWGSSPFHWYFTSAIPRCLLLSVLFVPFATRKCLRNFFTIPIIFVSIYSILPHKELRFILYVIPLLNTCAANSVAIMVEKFEGNKPCPESYLVNYVYKVLKYPNALSYDEEVAADKEREEREREEEEIKARIEKNKLPPLQYDAINCGYNQPYSSIQGSGSSYGSVRNRKQALSQQRNGVEAVLDEQYSKITAAVLEKHKSIDTILKNNANKKENNIDYDADPPEVAQLSCTFILIFILMGIHIWCNVGCTVYASLASWNNYPGGDAISLVNHHIKTVDLIDPDNESHDTSNINDGGNRGKKYKPSEIGVYVTNLAAQTGFSRFLHLDGVIYDKSPTLDHVANRTIYLRKGKGFNKHITHDFSPLKVIYLIMEKIDVGFLQSYCVSTKDLRSGGDKSKSGTSNAGGSGSSSSSKGGSNASSIEGVICNFGENAKHCKIVKVVNGFNGIDLSLTSKHVVIKTAPMLWVFKCVK